MWWLLEEDTRRAMQAAANLGAAPTAEQQTEFEARERSSSDLLTVVGSNSEIRIEGVLTQRPDFRALFFGGGNTTYPDIISALAEAEADPTVESITLAIDSPGGQFAGLFDTLAALQAVKKPLRAEVGGMAASAAYAIASQAGAITAANRASQVGSIGVATSILVRDGVVNIASSKAPKKRPDVTTKAGKAVIQEQLDDLHDIFVDAIATGRNMSVDAVNKDFGQGAVLLADRAKSRGMIDAIAGGGAGTGGEDPTEAKLMDIQTLKSDHPALYAEIIGVGVAGERDRVTAHLIMGEKSGAMETAVAAVRDGSGMTATLQAEYMTAGMNRSDIRARQDDDDDAKAADDAKAPTEEGDAEAVVSLVESKLGLEVE